MSTARVAIVTGGAQGIGEAIALRLADDGVDVVVSDIPGKEEQLATVVKQIELKGRRSLFVTANVSVEADIKGLVDKTVEAFGGLDIMIANAGITLFKPFLDTTPEDWDKMFATNTTGVMLSYKYAALQMIKQGRGGRIIGIFAMSAYSASKFAVRGLTQAVGETQFDSEVEPLFMVGNIAQELRPHKITVNCYAPGFILTPMLAHPDDDKFGGLGSVAKMAAKMPDDLEGAKPSVVAELVAYFTKPEAYFVTGQTINVDGGLMFD
ncbi:hypothetical protein NLI96_g3496 [Meripilus lineatus]|uniref:NAD(P)-binding protein n=1 Tax=Meripilus lineatus TaxID=2056292 RepID=A0AAD5V842_9APHY|nr:hypothetical protein NLI96_g3496 [Physisporinus lineatus]